MPWLETLSVVDARPPRRQVRRSRSSKISHLAALRLGGSPPLVGFFSTLLATRSFCRRKGGRVLPRPSDAARPALPRSSPHARRSARLHHDLRRQPRSRPRRGGGRVPRGPARAVAVRRRPRPI